MTPKAPAASSSTCKKNAAQEVCQTGAPLRIPPDGSVWVPKEAFQHIPTVNLMDDGDPEGVIIGGLVGVARMCRRFLKFAYDVVRV